MPLISLCIELFRFLKFSGNFLLWVLRQSVYRYISTKDCFPFCRMPLKSVVAFDAQKCFDFVRFCLSVLWIISWTMLEEIMFVPKIITCYDACFSLVITDLSYSIAFDLFWILCRVGDGHGVLFFCVFKSSCQAPKLKRLFCSLIYVFAIFVKSQMNYPCVF